MALRNSYLLALLASFFFILAPQVQAFSDLPESHHYHHALTYLNWEGVIEGYPDGTVRPDNTINRAELMKILVEGQKLLEGKSPANYKDCFPDVTDEWFAPFVCYAAGEDWVDGYPDGTFKPDQLVNKAEALKMVLNAFGIVRIGPKQQYFNDVEIGSWFTPYMQIAIDKGLLEEQGQTNFYAGNNRTRGEIAEMVARIKQIQYMDDPVFNETIRAEFETFFLLHKLREENGVTERLTLNPTLTQVARLHAQDMHENLKQMSHFGSDGRASWERIREGGLGEDAARTGENVGTGTVSQYRSIFKAVSDVHYNIFMPEPDGVCNHRTTILSTCLPFTEVGVGIFAKDGRMYFTQDFITRENAKVSFQGKHIAVPSSYTIGNGYNTITDDDNYSYSTTNCTGGKVRTEYFVQSGVAFKENGECYVYEFAYHPESNYYLSKAVDADTINDMALTIDTTSNIYAGVTTIDFDETYITVAPYSINGWDIPSHEYPYDFNTGTATVMTLKNSKTAMEKTIQLDFTEAGWIKVTEL